MALLIKGATLLSGKTADILIEGNKIAKVSSAISASCEKINAKGKIAIPGLVNTHTHAPMSLFKGIAEDMKLEAWLSKVRKAEEKLTAKQVYIGTMLACLEMIKSGTTCFSDMYFHMHEVAKAASKSGIRATLGYGMVDLGDEKKRKKELSIAEKLVKDWHGKGKMRCSIAPHSIYLCSKELLIAANKLSSKYSVPYHMHLSETRKEVFVCLEKTKKRPAYYLNSLGVLSKRTVLAHCVWLTKEEVRLLASKQVSASLNPVSNMKLAGGSTAPMPEMQEFGMNISLGTDGSASNNSLSMLETMKTLGLLQKNCRWDPRVANAQSLFSAATLGGARALGINAGSLKPGLLADIILLDKKAANLVPSHSLLANLIYSAHAGNITDSIIGGKLVMKDRKILTFNEEKVVEQAEKEKNKLTA